MFSRKARWDPRGGHKPCLCEGVAGLRSATPSPKHGLYCFCSVVVVVVCVCVGGAGGPEHPSPWPGSLSPRTRGGGEGTPSYARHRRVERGGGAANPIEPFMVLWHGWSCKEVCGKRLWVGPQDDATTLQSIHSMHRWPPLQRRRNKICWRIVKRMLSNCFEMFILGKNWTTWYFMVSS